MSESHKNPLLSNLMQLYFDVLDFSWRQQRYNNISSKSWKLVEIAFCSFLFSQMERSWKKLKSEKAPQRSLEKPQLLTSKFSLKLRAWNSPPRADLSLSLDYLLLALQLLSCCHSPANETIWRHWKSVYLFSPADLLVYFAWDNSPLSKISYLQKPFSRVQAKQNKNAEQHFA